jgi:DNA segregation ATPase FtsK/SpoIIIE-like protein
MATQAIEGQPAPAPFIGLIPSLRQWLLKVNALQLPEKIQHFVVRWIIGYRSQAEKIELQQRKLQRMEAEKARDQLMAEAEGYAREIRNTYTRYGVCYRYKKSEKDSLERIQEVEFIRPFIADNEVVKLLVDTRHLPRGIGIQNLEDDHIKWLLSLNCKHRVITHSNTDCGYWIWIERAEGLGGIPRHISFEEMVKNRPAHLSGERLAFPLGMGENHKFVWRTVPQAGNLLIAGSPDSGKSNFANAIISCLLKHNTPQQLKLLLVDLKGGLEFSFYSGLTDYLLKIPKPRLKREKEPEEIEKPETDCEATDELADEAPAPETAEASPESSAEEDVEDEEVEVSKSERIPAFIERREFVPAALAWLIGEAERRMGVLKKANCKKIQQYNQKNPFNMMPYVVAFIDEWADVKLDRALGAKSEDKLINITNRARATGIYVYLATQSPNKDVLSIRVKNAMNSRMIFRCADQYMSQGLVGTYEASTIDVKVKGRGFWVSGSDRIELQTPYIPNEMVESIVAEVSGGKVVEINPAKRHDVQEREIFEWALEENDGKLGWREVYEKFRLRGFTAEDAKLFGKERMGKTFEVDGVQYELKGPSGFGYNRQGYRLLPIT